jgi:hypothetical protein
MITKTRPIATLLLLSTLVMGCSDQSPDSRAPSAAESVASGTTEAAQPTGAPSTSVPVAYVEYLQCQFGENYSADSFQAFLAAWNSEIDQLEDRGLSAFGYLPRDWQSDRFDGIWVLRWPNKDSRNAGWQTYAASGAEARIQAAHPGVIECAPDEGLDLFAFNAYTQRPTPPTWSMENPPYAVSMQICSMADGRPVTNVRDFVTADYLPYLAKADERLPESGYWYQVAFMDQETSTGTPSTAEGPFDFVWMNFWNSPEQESISMADWSDNGQALQSQFDAMTNCQAPIPYDGYYFRTNS